MRNPAELSLSEAEVKCPICFAEGKDLHLLHPVEVRVNAGGSITKVDHGGTRMEAGHTTARGVVIEIVFRNENCDHEITHRYQFHKGSTTLELLNEVKPSVDSSVDPLESCPYTWTTIWRD